MAVAAKALSTNIPGDFYVDDTCIDCGACRWIAPDTFDRAGEMSRVHAQPTGADAAATALRALVACPTASIGCREKHNMNAAVAAFPQQVAEGVYFCGYTSRHSFGAAAWLVVRPDGNVLVDSPRYVDRLADRIEAMGGVKLMLLTHQDDVADHAQFHKRFGCKRAIHEADQRACPEAEIVLRGSEEQELGEGLLAIPTPGHTAGSVCYLHDRRALFTGDHLAYSRRLGHLYAFRDACWHSWSAQLDAMRRLAEHSFTDVLPGHGAPLLGLSRADMAAQIAKCLAWMATAPEI
jgi:glyoxylase-like metal-dependent hydrolase (beta-lactamase superfamily II)/ferredoxin